MSPTVQVIGGGEPSDEQLAALTIGVETLLAEDAAALADAAPRGWVVAALTEGVGGLLVSEPPEGVSWQPGGSPRGG